MRGLRIALLIALFAGGIVSSLAAENVSSPAKENVVVTGSTVGLTVVQAVAKEFNAEQKDCIVNVSGGGTNKGITDIAKNKTSDIAMASRTLYLSEKMTYGDRFDEFDIGLSAIVIGVSRPIYESGVKGLTTEQVRGIYSGKIKNWKEVGGPNKIISVIGYANSSQQTTTFNETIMGNATPNIPGVSIRAQNESAVMAALFSSDNAIGFLNFNNVVNVVSIDGVSPTIDNIKNGSYKLVHPYIYFYTYGDPKPCAKKFIDFFDTPKGQNITAQYGIVSI